MSVFHGENAPDSSSTSAQGLQSVDNEDGEVQRTKLKKYNVNDDLYFFSHKDGTGLGLRDEDCEINVYKTKATTHRFEEPEFFPEYRRLLMEGGFISTFVRILTNEIASRYYFESDDEEALRAVEDFWFENDVADELEEMVLQSILMGTGVGFLETSGQRADNFRRVDVQSVNLERDDGGEISVEQTNGTTRRKNITDNSMLLRFFRFPDTPWGISFVRPMLIGVQGLEDLFRDIPPAIKQLAYVDRVLKLDLDDVNDPAEKKKILQNARDSFAEYDSATTTVVVMDQNNNFGYMGNVEGTGGGNRRIDPILPAIKPILLTILMQFNVPVGEFIQEDANRGIMDEQKASARKRVQDMREKFTRTVEKNIIAPLLDEEGRPSVRMRYKPEPMAPRDEAQILQSEWESGIISREEVRRRRGFKGDPEGTMVTDIDLGESPGSSQFSTPGTGDSLSDPIREFLQENKQGDDE